MWRVFAIAFLLASMLLPPAQPQTPAPAQPSTTTQAEDEPDNDNDIEPVSTLAITLEPSGSAQVSLTSTNDFVKADAIRSYLTGAWSCRLGTRTLPFSSLVTDRQREAIEESERRMSGRILHGQCSGLTRRNGILNEGVIELQPLLNLLRANGGKSLELTISLPKSPVREVVADFKAASLVKLVGFWSFSVPLEAEHAPLRVKFGYRSWDIYRICAGTGFYIAIPIVLVLLARATALRRGKDDPAAAWFSYLRMFQLAVNATFLLWCGTQLNPRGQLVGLFSFLGWQEGWKQVLSFVLVLMVPAWTVYVTCTMLSYKVFRQIKNAEWTRADFLKEQFATLGKVFFALGFFVAAALMAWQNPRLAMVLFLLAFLSSAICSSLAQRFARSHPAAVTAGPLRDRIFEMANRMGVKLRQVFVIAATKTSTANAFATTKQTIIFTDYLIGKLSQREVDAIAAHELTHLQHSHAQKSVMALWTVIFLPNILPVVIAIPGGIVIGFFMAVLHSSRLLERGMEFGALMDSPWTRAVILVAGFAAFYYLRRRFEYTADRGAAAVTGDPEATITALLRISRLGLLPLQWGRGSESMLTHPSTLRRVQRVAAAYRIPPEQLQQIIHSVHDAPEPVREEQGQRYDVSENAPGVVPIRKSLGRARLRLWFLIALHILPAAGLVFALQHLPRIVSWRPWVMAAGLAGSMTIYHFAVRGSAWTMRRRYAGDARAAAQKQIGPFEQKQAVAVGFAPGPTPRFFIDGYNWDYGVLFFTPEKIVFAGGQVGFALTRDQIRLIVPGEGGPGWTKSPRVYFTWLDKKTGRYGTFNLALLDQKGWFTYPAQARDLYKRIEAWRNRRAGAEEFSLLTELGPPEVGAVTSMSPKEINKFSRWISMSAMIVGLAWAFALVLGLQSSWYVCCSAFVLRIYESIPYWRYRERAYVSDPVFPAGRQAAPVPPPPPLAAGQAAAAR